jgi:hypothetical protein
MMRALAVMSPGTIELVLVRHEYQSGELVVGRVQLALEDRVQGSRLVVGVHATAARELGGAVERRTRYRMERQLGGYGLYLGDERYDFQLPLPVGAAGLSWRIYAFLDLAWRGRVETSTDILVSSAE